MLFTLRTSMGINGVICTLVACAQFDALPMSNASWATSFWVGPGYPHEGYYHAFDQDSPDTLFDGQVFKKLTVRFSSGGYVYPGSSYGGALRDNGIGQVFYWEPWAAEPQLLYDFDVLPGDTVVDAYLGWAFVHSVDTVIVNALPRKRIGLACVDQQGWASEHWIQGIGGTGGFFYSSLCGSVSGTGVLVCMSESDTIQYGSGEGDLGVCDIFLGEAEANNAPVFRASPNPGTTSLHVVYGPSSPTGPVLRAYNAQGRVLGQWMMEHGEADLNTASWPAGVYMIEYAPGSRPPVKMKWIKE